LDILRCVSGVAAHGGVEIHWLKLHDTLKINPRIENYQNHKKSSEALHEKKGEKLQKVKKFD